MTKSQLQTRISQSVEAGRPVDLPRHILRSVEKPARYVGGEYHAVDKSALLSARSDPAGEESAAVRPLLRFAFCFPDIYEIGMSNLALQIIYERLNQRQDTWCERVFAPWVDMEAALREHDLPLFSLESRTPLADFELIGFTLQSELSYTNVLNMLDLGRIPLRAAERCETDPIVIAGGPCVYNLEPMAAFFDLAIVGEGEDALDELIACRLEGDRSGKGNRLAFLQRAAKIPGVYVPAFYTVTYQADGTVASIEPNDPAAAPTVSKRLQLDLDATPMPRRPVVPNLEIVHDRMFLELFRGCARGCRFCQAGMVGRPVRERSVETLRAGAEQLAAATGYDEAGLLSLSTSDYRQLEPLTDVLLALFDPCHTSLSLPSLRLDNFSFDLMRKVSSTRKSGLTFAPEAGTQRLRDVINKNITQADLEASMRLAFAGGWKGAKLYFMIGLPTETDEDVLGIVEMARSIEALHRSLPRDERPRQLELSISVAVFIPKPFTPFQWSGQADEVTVWRRIQLLREQLRNRSVKLSWHDPHASRLEAILARGDRRLAEVVESAWRQGCTFDAWDDQFRWSIWQQAIREAGLDEGFYAERERPADEVLPWSHIDCGVTPDFLRREYERALAGQTTAQCRERCSSCGAAQYGTGVCYEH